MAKLFHPDAPLTVRMGAIGVLLLTVVDGLVWLEWAWYGGGSEIGLWYGLWRPFVRLSAGIAFVWGIGQMFGVFYWGWLITSMLVLAVELAGPIVRLMSVSPDIGAVTFGPAATLAALLWLVTTGLLLVPRSIRAYCQHGRLWSKSTVG